MKAKLIGNRITIPQNVLKVLGWNYGDSLLITRLDRCLLVVKEKNHENIRHNKKGR